MIINSNTAAANLLPTTTMARKSTSKHSAPEIGANQAQLTSVSSDNLTAAGAPIQNEDEANATAEAARQMIIAQNSMAMMAQANSVPLRALGLLQQ
jgi:flagellin-like hook-associated protein FlgL